MAAARANHRQDIRQALPSGTGSRVIWIDALRGIGITLVVFAHCMRGLETAGLIPLSPGVMLVDRIIYSFHMPLFFLLSGLTFEITADRRAPAAFLRDRLLRLLWPLALWTWIFFGFRAASAGLSNAQSGWSDIPLNPLPPQAHFWFLWALFVLTSLFYLLRRLWLAVIGREGLPVFWALALAISLIVALSVPVPDALAVWLVPSALFAPCLIAGIIIARRAPPPPGPVTTAVSGLVFAALLVLAAMTSGRASDLFIALLAPVALAQFVQGVIRPGALTDLLARLGTASMAIFLAHTIFSAALRIALTALGITTPALHLALGTAIGLAGPLLLWHLARRFGLSRLLGF